MQRAANSDPFALASAMPDPALRDLPAEPSFIFDTDAVRVFMLASQGLPPPAATTVAAAVPAGPRCSISTSNLRIVISPPLATDAASRKLLLEATIHQINIAIATKGAAAFIIETSIQQALGLSPPELAHSFDIAVRRQGRATAVQFALAPPAPIDHPEPPPQRIAVTSFSMRFCPTDTSCSMCDLHDIIFKEEAITLDTPLKALLKFGMKLRERGYRKHSPPANVFRAPEESTPVPLDQVDPQLRKEVQGWFDEHARNPPAERPAARSPLYDYDLHGGILPKWSTPPSTKVRSRTQPGTQQRYVLYREMLLDTVCGDVQLADSINDIRASCALFVAWHPTTGKPRPCAAPYEANDATPPASVRYGNARDLFAVPGVTSGVRLDFARGFKHIPLSRIFAIHVAFILDGVPIIPLSVFFGLRDGPLIFCSTLEQDMASAPTPPPPPGAVVSPRISWVDDVAQLGDPPNYLVQVFFSFVKHMASRNWKFGVDKCFMLPNWILKFIGMLIDAINAAFRIPPSTAAKLAAWAVRILVAGSADVGQPVTPVQHALIESHMGRLSWVTSIGFHMLSFARKVIDTSLAQGTWVRGARELLMHHAQSAHAWAGLKVTVAPPTITARLATDGSVCPDHLEVTGSGHLTLPNQPPMHFTIAFSSAELQAFGFVDGDHRPSSTWAEAAVATVGAYYTSSILKTADPEGLIQGIDHAVDSRTVASRAELCSAADYQCSAFYYLIHRLSSPRSHSVVWISREEEVLAKADAGSDAALGLWRPVELVRSAIKGSFSPDLDLTADLASSTALRYSSPHHPVDPTRLRNLIALSTEACRSGASGFVGAPGHLPWSGLKVFGVLTPSYSAVLPDISRIALSSTDWTLSVIAVLSPDIIRILASWIDAGVSFLSSLTPCSTLHSVLVAPSGDRPRLDFPVRLITASKGSNPPSPPSFHIRGWCSATGPIQVDRTRSAEENFLRWVMSGQCPHPGPGEVPRSQRDRSTLLPQNTFAVAAAALTRQPTNPTAPAPLLSPFEAAALPAAYGGWSAGTATAQPSSSRPRHQPHAFTAAVRSTAVSSHALTVPSPPPSFAYPSAAGRTLAPAPTPAPAPAPPASALPYLPQAPRPLHTAATSSAAAAVTTHAVPGPTAAAPTVASPVHRPLPPPASAVSGAAQTATGLTITHHPSQLAAPATSSAASMQRPPQRHTSGKTAAAHPLPAVAPASRSSAMSPPASAAGSASPQPDINPQQLPQLSPAVASERNAQQSQHLPRSAAPLEASAPPARLPTARSVRTRVSVRAASAASGRKPRSASSKRARDDRVSNWVDGDIRCGQCHRFVAGDDDSALLCDEESCNGWLVCSTCIPHDPNIPLRCPVHQATHYLNSLRVQGGMKMALAHKPATIGRVLGCLTAWAGSKLTDQKPIEMAEVLSKAPISIDDSRSALPPTLREDSDMAERSLWNDDRRKRCRLAIFHITWLAQKLGALDAAIMPAMVALAKAYIRHRLSPDRPPGWRKASSDHVKTEMSQLARLMEDLQWPIAPYLGTRRVLEARGAFLKKEHSPRWPIPPFRVFEKAALEPRPMTSERQLAVDALQWHCFWGVRPGYLWKLRKSHYTPHMGGFLCKWYLQTKVKRGDKEAGPDAKLSIPQVSAARHVILSDIFSRAPADGPMFEAAKTLAPKILKEWFGDEVLGMEDFVLAHAGIRNGLDMALQAFSVPPDHIDAHLWWARSTPCMRAYYAGLMLGIMFYATERLHLIRFKPLAPGWFDTISKPPVPCWEEIPPLVEPSASQTQTLEVEDLQLESDLLGPAPCQAPSGLVSEGAARRRRRVVKG